MAVPPHRKVRRKERRRRTVAAVAAVTVVFVFSTFLCVYGLHTHMAQTAARAAARDVQIAIATGAALHTSSVLFVPEYGSVCRRRWIDNATWTLRDGGEVECAEEAAWNATIPAREHNVERRMDAIRNVFQARGAGKVE